MIKKCTCANEYQDRRYGPKMRVFNPVKDPSGNQDSTKGRCTVCGKEST